MKFGVCERPEEDANDEVIATYSVYTSPSLQHQLHIFQFPLRRKMRPYEAAEVRLFATEGIIQKDGESESAYVTTSKDATAGAFLKPSSRLTMHCCIDTFGTNSFTSESTPQYAEPQPSDHSFGSNKQQENRSYHYALQSHPFQPRCNYAIGYIVDGAIHLSPVATIQQFTPVVKPLTASGAHRVSDVYASSLSAASPHSVSIPDRAGRNLMRQRSVMLNTDAVTARELQCFVIDSVESKAMRRLLWSPAYEANCFTRTLCNTRPCARIDDSLFPPELLISGGISGGEDADVAGNILQCYANRYSVMEQVLLLLRRCQVVTVDEMRALVMPPDDIVAATSSTSRRKPSQSSQKKDIVSDEELLMALRKGAVMMHGVWVAKSSMRFKGTVAGLREVILLKFYESDNASVSRAQLNHLFTSTTMQQITKEVLESVAILNSDEPNPAHRFWRLRCVPAAASDREALMQATCNAFPQEFAFQRMQWEKLRPHIIAHVALINAGQAVERLVLTVQRQEGGADVANIAGVAASNMGAPTTSFTDEELAPVMRHIRHLFLEHGVLNIQRAKELVMKGKQQHYPTATIPMLSAALQRSVQSFANATWVLKSLGETEVDRYRPLILETARELGRFEISAFNAHLEEKRRQQSRDELTNSEDIRKIVSRVLAEIAVYKQHERLWHLKSGNVIIE